MTRCPGGIWSGERGASQASERSVHTRPDSAVGALLCSEFATPPRVLGATGLDGSPEWKRAGWRCCCVCEGVRSRTPCCSPRTWVSGCNCAASRVIAVAGLLFTGSLMLLLGTCSSFFLFCLLCLLASYFVFTLLLHSEQFCILEDFEIVVSIVEQLFVHIFFCRIMLARVWTSAGPASPNYPIAFAVRTVQKIPVRNECNPCVCHA